MKLGLPHPSRLLPLKSLGLEPGRALANAKPTAEQRQKRRAEQFRYIVLNCAERQQVTSSSPSIEARERSLG